MKSGECEKGTRKPNLRKLPVECPLCGESRPQNEMYYAKLWFEKLLFLLAALHKQRIPLATVQTLYSEASPFFVCPEHTFETNKVLLSMLGVELPNDIPRASREAVNSAMDVAMSFQTGNESLPILSNWHFLQIVLNFVAKHPNRVITSISARPSGGNRNSHVVGIGPPSRFRCRVCEKIQPSRELKHITLQDEKLLILLAAIQKEEIAVSIAQHLYSIQKMLTCRTHLEDACETLKKMLGVADANEIFTKMGTFEAHNAVGLANCLLAEPISESVFMRQMQEICLNYCDYSKRPKLLPAPPPQIDNYKLLFEPNDMEVGREEVIDDTEASWNERRMEMLMSEDDEDIIIDVESIDDVAPPAVLQLEEAPPTLGPIVKPVLHTCRICSKQSEAVRVVSLRFEKMCILLVSVHRNEISSSEARRLHELAEITVCNNHFAGSCRDLFAMMKLVHPMGVPADKKVMGKVIELANLISDLRPLKEHMFIHLCSEYWQKYGGDRGVTPIKTKSETIETCRLCGKARRRSEVRGVSVLSEKMLVLVAEVFTGTMTKGLARQYFHQLRELVICQWHLPEVCKTLCTMFNIPRPENFRFPKESIVKKAMLLVNVIQKGKHPFSTTDGKHLVQQCQRFTNKYWKKHQF